MSSADRPRLRWRCRRGMKELDLLLSRWLDHQFDDATEAQRALFEQLLALPDPQLASYLVAGEPPEATEASDAADTLALSALIQSIRTGTRIMSSPTPAEPTGREP